MDLIYFGHKLPSRRCLVIVPMGVETTTDQFDFLRRSSSLSSKSPFPATLVCIHAWRRVSRILCPRSGPPPSADSFRAAGREASCQASDTVGIPVSSARHAAVAAGDPARGSGGRRPGTRQWRPATRHAAVAAGDPARGRGGRRGDPAAGILLHSRCQTLAMARTCRVKLYRHNAMECPKNSWNNIYQKTDLSSHATSFHFGKEHC